MEALKPPRVLLAEGDASLRRVLAGVLRNLGMTVEELVDGGRLLVEVARKYKDERLPGVLPFAAWSWRCVRWCFSQPLSSRPASSNARSTAP
jgi:hypothetical protein